jgi:hypothetical protein
MLRRDFMKGVRRGLATTIASILWRRHIVYWVSAFGIWF